MSRRAAGTDRVWRYKEQRGERPCTRECLFAPEVASPSLRRRVGSDGLCARLCGFRSRRGGAFLGAAEYFAQDGDVGDGQVLIGELVEALRALIDAAGALGRGSDSRITAAVESESHR